ncbi:MAG: FkbM family methyltransferase [Desulfobacterales bacterium]|nr:FkbM family methyltransferase [Desulfobacterales bacterium]
MHKFYSQNGEDFLLWSLFENLKKPGFFVEVGALDGIRFSNTYFFESKDWKGICIEPQPEYFKLLSKNRPNSYCFEGAASNENGYIDFYADKNGDFSTLINSNAERAKAKNKVEDYKKIIVPINRLDEILEKAKAPVPIEFVSIDVEGAEQLVLEGFDISHYKPRVLIVEANDAKSNQIIDQYMKKYGYFKAGRLKENNFYCRTFTDLIRLSLIPLKCSTIYPPHPLNPREGINDSWRTKHFNEGSFAKNNFKKFVKRIFNRFKG